MTAQRPDTIKVGPIVYTVRLKKRIVVNGKPGCMGSLRTSRATITLDKNLAPSKMREVLLHEVLHACYDGAGLNDDEPKDEERVVNSLGYRLLDVLRDNPKLVAYLCDRG